MMERTHGRKIVGERRRGVDSKIPEVSIAHLEGTILEVKGAVLGVGVTSQ